MKLTNDISEWFNDKFNLINTNSQIKKNKKIIERKYNDLLDEMYNLSVKYTDLLERKAESFDLYLHYKNQCAELTAEKKELKKQLANKTEQCNALIEENKKMLTKLEKPRKKLVNKNEKSN